MREETGEITERRWAHRKYVVKTSQNRHKKQIR